MKLQKKKVDKLLETPRLVIRKISSEDCNRLVPILGDPEVMRYSLKGACDEKGILEYVGTILSHYKHHGYGLWALVLKETGELIGIAGLIHQIIDGVPYVEVSYRLARAFWKQGFAIEAAEGIKEYAFKSLKIPHLISIIEPANVASVNVAKKMGMLRGKSTKFHGCHVDIYEIQRGI